MKRMNVWAFLLMLPIFISLGVYAADDGAKKLIIQKYPGNYSCFLIQFPSGVVVVTDPYNIYEEIRADIVTESHDHLDHTDVSKIVKPYQLINTCRRFEAKGVKITGFPGRHNKGDQEISNIIYVIEADGFRIVHFGSQGELPNPAVLMEIGKVDVLIIQSFSYFPTKLNPAEVKRVADKLEPKIVIPAHGDDSYTIREKLAILLNGGTPLNAKDGRLELDQNLLGSIKPAQVMVLNN